MEKKRSVLRSNDHPETRPRRGRSSSRQLASQVVQDRSLPAERSLQIDKSMVRHLDSMAATPEHLRPRRVLHDDTAVSSVAMTPGWTKYLDGTFRLTRLSAAKRSRISGSDDNSLTEQIRSLEDVSKSPEKQPKFEHRRKNVLPKGVGVELFGAAFDSPKAKSSAVSPVRPERISDLSVDNFEDISPIVTRPFRKRRRVIADLSVFKDVFKDSASFSSSSVTDVPDRLEERRRRSAHLSASPLKNNKPGNQHIVTSEQNSGTKTQAGINTPSITKKFKKGQTGLESLSVTASENKESGDESRQKSASLSVTASENQESGDESRQMSARLSFMSPEKRRSRNKSRQKSAIISVTAPENESGGKSRQKSASMSVTAPENESGDKSRQKSASLSVTASENKESGDESRQKSASLSVTAPENQESGDESRQMSARLSFMSPEKRRSRNKSRQKSAIISVTAPENKEATGELTKKSENLSVVVAEDGKSGDKLRQKSALLLVTTHNSNRLGNEHVDTMEQQSSPKRRADINTPSVSKVSGKEQTELESADVHPGSVSDSSEMNQNAVQQKATQDGHNIFSKSVKPRTAPWFGREQEKVSTSKNLCAFNLLPREERSSKLRELVSEVKKKYDDALKPNLTNGLFSRERREIRNIKDNVAARERTGGKKKIHPALLVDGKRYRPRLKRPKSWATPRLYKLLIPKCEEKYGMLKARCKAEEFVVFLCEKVSTVIRRKKYENYESILEEIKRALYKLGIIKCLMEYFVFIEDYLPFEYRIKAIPCLRGYGKRTGPPLAPGTDLFADLGY